jgi:glycosyltransferase involved in cell wall biosynthesis
MNPNTLTFSIIIPVYNRPEELGELLTSLAHQTQTDFEIIVVEDGSTVKSNDVVKQYQDQLDIHYIYKDNTGPGLSRNAGVENATGTYYIFLDSDCILPPHYFQTVRQHLETEYLHAFGGPDRAHPDFTPLQKAINYSMTSFFTTGGIRGGTKKLDVFYPRSFNMGFSKEVYQQTHGFSAMRFGEDLDMSIRILAQGFRTRLIQEAFVYHKRRSNLKQFFKQVTNSGIARINLYKKYPASLKPVHLLPSMFTIGVILLLPLAIAISPLFLLPILVHVVLIFLDAGLKEKSITIAWHSVLTSYVQLLGYGTGFLMAVWKRIVLHRGEFSAFTKSFYK